MQSIQYEDYQRLIAGRANHWARYSRSIGKSLPFDELMSEGNLEFVKAMGKFDPEKQCLFSTLLTIRLNHRYHNLVCRSVKSVGGRNRPYDSELEDEILLTQMPSQDASPERSAALSEMIRHLGHDAQLLVECALNTPKELIQMLGHRRKHVKVTRYSLERYFTKQKGWPASRVRRATTKIREALEQL